MYDTREFFDSHDRSYDDTLGGTYGDQAPEVYDAAYGGFTTGVTHFDAATGPAPGMEPPANTWEFEQGLAQLLEGAEEEPARPAPHDEPVLPARPPVHRRRRREFGLRLIPPRRMSSLLIAALTAAIVAMVSVLGGIIAYNPLRHLASPTASGSLAGWWPLLVYGPWLAASLSILRAALHRQRAAHSWVVVVLFSSIAVFLCVIDAPRNVTAIAVGGLPPITALVSFHQLVRQITLIDLPRHALPRQRVPPSARGGAARLARPSPDSRKSSPAPSGRSGPGERSGPGGRAVAAPRPRR